MSLINKLEDLTGLARCLLDKDHRGQDFHADDLDWRERLRASGYVHLRGLVPATLVTKAREAIEHDLATNYDPARQEEYDSRSYCPALRSSPAIMDLVEKSRLRNLIDAALGWEEVRCDPGQVAIRRARNAYWPILPKPHLDGYAYARNGLRPGHVYNFTAIVGVFLGPTIRSYAGNLTVWPGSHRIYERHFRDRGPAALREGIPTPDGIGRPVQLLCDAGDIVMTHFLLGHAVSVNMSARDRYAVYFRLRLRGIQAQRWFYLTHAWARWRI